MIKSTEIFRRMQLKVIFSLPPGGLGVFLVGISKANLLLSRYSAIILVATTFCLSKASTGSQTSGRVAKPTLITTLFYLLD